MQTPLVHGIDELAQLFSILHDGVVAGASASDGDLILHVEIRYLTERIQPGFRVFQLHLHRVEDLAFVTWPKDANAQPQVLRDIGQIFVPGLGILSGNVAGARVEVVCNQDSPLTLHCGGTLTFRAASATVADEGGAQYSLTDLAAISRAYWDDWEKRNGHVKA